MSAADLATQLRTTLGKLRRQLRDQTNSEDLTPSQIAVLLRLESNGPATASDLARAEAMRPQSMSAILTALQQQGLLTTHADPTDGRKTLISLSKKCRQRLHQARTAKQDWLTAAIAEKLSEPEQRQIAKSLALLNRLTQKD